MWGEVLARLTHYAARSTFDVYDSLVPAPGNQVDPRRLWQPKVFAGSRNRRASGCAGWMQPRVSPIWGHPREPAGSFERRPDWPAQHSDQRPLAALFFLARRERA